MFYSDIVLKAKDYVKKLLLSNNIDKEHWYLYHNLWHTLDVFERTSYLAEKEWLNEELQEMMQLAALFHDTWFSKQYDKNEPIWAQIAEDFLKENNIPVDKIDIIKNIILATIFWREPLSHLEEIIKDADMDNLWREDYCTGCKVIKEELKIFKDTKIDQKVWLEHCFDLLKNYKFYTQTSKKERMEWIKQNIKRVKDKLKNM